MSRLWMCGFEQGHTGVFTPITGAPIIDNAQKRTGAYSFYCGDVTRYGTIVLPVALSEAFIREAMRPSNGWGLPVENRFLEFGAIFLTLDNVSHKPQIWAWPNLLATGTTVCDLNVWHVFYVRFLIGNPNGIVQVRVDDPAGPNEIDYLGDTQRGGAATFTDIRTGLMTGSGAFRVHIDDIAVNDTAGALNNSWPGAGGIYGIVPTGVGAHAQWTPSAGANWDCVDEVPPSDADFVSDATSGHQDSYAMANTPGVGIVDALCYWARAKKDLVGDKDLKRLFRIGGVDYAGAALALPTAVGYVKEILETSPDTLVPFTTAEIDAMEAGQEVA